jgi:hypothetical protein
MKRRSGNGGGDRENRNAKAEPAKGDGRQKLGRKDYEKELARLHVELVYLPAAGAVGHGLSRWRNLRTVQTPATAANRRIVGIGRDREAELPGEAQHSRIGDEHEAFHHL